ncbi:sulfatase family protein [Neolewinella antarctica]|uniref:Arylsulfatase A-like enzyme n=1 Tax=Neolewinella antarctica TaxID=442734 RepID=A0ABX0XHV0_9BACT|nr:sulfatase [Neolewinella antarctica]NJC28459.1 arylsulfatase A-like enzyme [Neolewinella antarctica]
MHKYFHVTVSACLLVASCFLVSCADAGAEEVGAANERPNIIFILTDDQRWDALGYAGNELISTPEMDRLAREGAYFSHAMVTTPICAASRASILSSRYERTHRFDFQAKAMREEYMADSYPILLRDAGYRTGFYGKFGVKYAAQGDLFEESDMYDRLDKYPDKRGYYYKQLDGDSVHLTRYTGEMAQRFIRDNKGDRPFSLSLCFSAPHAHDPAPEQYFWEPEGDKLLADTQIPPPALGDDRYFDAQPPAVRNGFNRLRWGWRYDTPEKYQHSVKGYYRMISGIDREIAGIRAELEAKGLADNTIIILMGDNGQFLGERQLAGKWLLYDNSVRVPLIVFDPRRGKHLDLDAMALNIDVPATMLDLAGVDRPAGWQGQSLLPLMDGADDLVDRDTVLLEHLWDFANIPPSEGVRTKKWKYFRYVNEPAYEELYNLEEDRAETINLVDNPDFTATLDRLRAKTNALTLELSDDHSAAPTALAGKSGRGRADFTWELPQSVGGQTAYQIILASSPEKLALNDGDLWNSGEVVATENSASEPVAGYAAGQQAYWKIRVWDEEHRLGRYSEPQTISQ